MQKLFTLIALLMLSGAVFSQSTVSQNNAHEPSQIKEEKGLPEEGTYQVIVTNEDIIANITREDLLQVESERKEDEITYITIDQYTKIKILPYNTIRSKDYIPLKKYSYEK